MTVDAGQMSWTTEPKPASTPSSVSAQNSPVRLASRHQVPGGGSGWGAGTAGSAVAHGLRVHTEPP